jgi:hypothetical protein
MNSRVVGLPSTDLVVPNCEVPTPHNAASTSNPKIIQKSLDRVYTP